MNRQLVILLMVLVCVGLHAQDDPEYRAEIGVGVGLSAYQGDLNGSLTKNMQPMYTAVAKYRINPRMAWAFNLSFGKLKGSSADVSTYYPELNDSPVEFDNSLVDAGLRFECNFWPYGTGREYRGAKPLTPFVAAGLGMTFVSTPAGSVNALNIPIGLGVKYKVADRLNLALEWMMHFTLSDKLEGVDDPYGIESSGLFKNSDSYSMLQLSVTYDIWAKCKTCNNDRF